MRLKLILRTTGGLLALSPSFLFWCALIGGRQIADWDLEISHWCHRPAMRRAWLLITRMGDGWLYAAVFIALRHLGRRIEARNIEDSVFAAWGASSLVKLLVRRERKNPVRWRSRMLSSWSRWSFPSQHAACAFAFAYALWPNPLTLGFAIAVSCSRVLIGAHYLGDVLAGVAVGLLAARLA